MIPDLGIMHLYGKIFVRRTFTGQPATIYIESIQ